MKMLVLGIIGGFITGFVLAVVIFVSYVIRSEKRLSRPQDSTSSDRYTEGNQ